MYFITKKDSETGKKFQVIVDKMKAIDIIRNEFLERHGFQGYQTQGFYFYGGLDACALPSKEIDSKLWRIKKNKRNELFYPNCRNKEGKIIKKEIENIPTISVEELNKCVNITNSIFNLRLIGIGFTDNSDQYFGFTAGDDWTFFKKPEDCDEITYTKFKELFQLES